MGMIIEKYIGRGGRKLFMLFCWLFTLLVIAAFTDMVAGTFVGTGLEDASTAYANSAAASISMLFILVVWSLVFLGGRKTGMFLIPMFIMVAGINVLNLFSYDRQTKWETYVLTLPVPRWKMVLEKYFTQSAFPPFSD